MPRARLKRSTHLSKRPRTGYCVRSSGSEFDRPLIVWSWRPLHFSLPDTPPRARSETLVLHDVWRTLMLVPRPHALVARDVYLEPAYLLTSPLAAPVPRARARMARYRTARAAAASQSGRLGILMHQRRSLPHSKDELADTDSRQPSRHRIDARIRLTCPADRLVEGRSPITFDGKRCRLRFGLVRSRFTLLNPLPRAARVT